MSTKIDLKDVKIICGRCTKNMTIRWIEEYGYLNGVVAHVECHSQHYMISIDDFKLRKSTTILFDDCYSRTDTDLKHSLEASCDRLRFEHRLNESLKMCLRSRAGERVE